MLVTVVLIAKGWTGTLEVSTGWKMNSHRSQMEKITFMQCLNPCAMFSMFLSIPYKKLCDASFGNFLILALCQFFINPTINFVRACASLSSYLHSLSFQQLATMNRYLQTVVHQDTQHLLKHTQEVNPLVTHRVHISSQ